MTAGNMRFDLASFWVQIWGSPFDMVSSSIVEAVGGVLEWWRRWRIGGNRTSQIFLCM